MIDHLVVHIGDAKAGSTAIQRSLAAKAWSAPGQAICYPTVLNHNLLVQILGRPGDREGRLRRFADMRSAFAASDAQVGVISSELLEFKSPEEIHGVLAHHLPSYAETARILCYVRPHTERFVSSFAQRMKQGDPIADLDASAAQTLVRDELAYADRLDRWRAVFGDRLEVRAMDRSVLRNGDVVDDFLGWVLGGAEVTLTDRPYSNDSLCVEDLVYLRLLYKALGAMTDMGAGDFAWLAVNAAPLIATRDPGTGTKLRLHQSLVPHLQDMCAADAARIDQEFIGSGTTMTDALAAAGDTAVADPIVLDPDAYYDARAQGHIQAHAALLARIRDFAGQDFNQMIEEPFRRQL